jgi:hypothetical protein
VEQLVHENSTLKTTPFFVSILVLASRYAAAQPLEPSSATPPDLGRLRFGIDATAGAEIVSAPGWTTQSDPMYGLDLRLGWQLNDLLAVYAQPHLSIGPRRGDFAVGSVAPGTITATVVATAIVEATFLDRLFIGAGPGWGALNSPSGLTIEGRFGGYPLMVRGSSGVRRKGLMIGADVRAVFLEASTTGTLLMACIGYEAF